MNAKIAKVLGLVIVLALVLSGCNLIEVDADMQQRMVGFPSGIISSGMLSMFSGSS